MLSPLQLQQILLGYIPNPQLELVLVMLVVPFIVNVSGASASTGWGGLEITVSPPMGGRVQELALVSLE